MKVKVEVTVDVDPARWADVASVDRADVRADIKSYVATHIYSGLPMLVDEAGAEIDVR